MPDPAVLGIDLGGTNVRVGAVQDGRLTRIEATRVAAEGSVDDVMGQLYALLDRFEVDAAAGIGVGVPSVVDVEAGVVYDVQNIPSWKAVPVRALLEERYGVPVFIDNDANCFALGEARFGKGRGARSMVGLILGTGFAGGLVVDGRLYSGRHAGAGEFGMMAYRDSIYEDYCSGQFFDRTYGVSAAAMHERAAEGDAEALEAFRAFGTHVGRGVEAILYALDPEVIVLGGSVRKAYPFFRDAVAEVIDGFAYTPIREDLRIEVSEDDHVALRGAAALALA